MHKPFIYLPLFVLSVFLGSCGKKATPEEYNAKAAAPELLHGVSEHLTNVIVYDIFKPPVASRIYAYSYLAAYEAMRNGQPKQYHSMAGKLNGFAEVPKPQANQAYCFPLAGVKAFTTVGRTLTFSANMWDDYEKDFYQKYREMGIPEDVYERSVAYGEQVAKHIMAYANEDNYKKTRGYRHTLSHGVGGWEPTPPMYAEACEPRWNTIRTFTLDSVSQFPTPPPVPYDPDPKSKFAELVREVHDISKNMTEEQKKIAYFWDDNALVTNIAGHAAFTEKKMSPPGHWMAIVRSVARDKKLDMLQATEAYALSAIGVFDAFIACWECKFKTDRVRPVTVINKSLDPDWMPFLETPPFPEYVSGHSAISASAGRILTHLLGDNVAFTDSTEYRYGHGVRSFKSFEQAYWETSMSRVYGGIHFRDGVEQGTYQGEKVGNWVWTKLKGMPGQKQNELARSVANKE